MKRNKQPEMYPLKITLTNGEVISIYTTSKDQKDLKLEVDVNNHPAWVGKEDSRIDLFDEVVKFKNKFKNLGDL